jgi:hypothetical protein
MALCVSAGFAGAPVASVTSAQSFNLDGTLVSNPGVNSWPVVVNDDVATFDRGGAILNFNDGSRVEMAANSRVMIQGSEANPRVVLFAGRMNYNLASGSHLSVLTMASQTTDTQTGAGQQPGSQPADKKKHDHDKDEVPPDTLSKQTQVLRVALPIAFAGLGIAVDAILQQSSASPR